MGFVLWFAGVAAQVLGSSWMGLGTPLDRALLSIQSVVCVVGALIVWKIDGLRRDR